MSIKASEISELIKARIQNFTAATEARSVGTVVTVTDAKGNVVSAPEVPAPLVSQLSPTGRLVVPVGPPGRQRLLVVKKLPSGRTRTEDAGEVAYVPLVGKFGWEKAPAEARR